MECISISDGAAIPRRSVSTMGLAALKISERCAHPFPTCDPAPRRTHTPVLAGGGSENGGSGSRRGGMAEDGLWLAPACHGRGAQACGRPLAAQREGARPFRYGQVVF